MFLSALLGGNNEKPSKGKGDNDRQLQHICRDV